MNAKPFYQSKTLWFNLISGILAVTSVIPDPISIGVTAAGNILLRIFFTSQPIG